MKMQNVQSVTNPYQREGFTMEESLVTPVEHFSGETPSGKNFLSAKEKEDAESRTWTGSNAPLADIINALVLVCVQNLSSMRMKKRGDSRSY